MPRRKLGRESSPNHSETLLRCATALEGSRDVVGTGLAKKVRGQVVGVGGVLPLPHWDCIPAPPHTCPPPSSHGGPNAHCPLWRELEPRQGCSPGRMWLVDRCNHGSQHPPTLHRSLGPAPVITSGGRKEGSPPGTQALAPGSLYCPCSLLSSLPLPEPPHLAPLQAPQAQGPALLHPRTHCKPAPGPCPPLLEHKHAAAQRPIQPKAALPVSPSPQHPGLAAIPSRTMGKCTHLGADRPGCIPSLAPTNCVTLGKQFNLCRLQFSHL